MYTSPEFASVYISPLTEKYYILPKMRVNLCNPTSIFIFSDKE